VFSNTKLTELSNYLNMHVALILKLVPAVPAIQNTGYKSVLLGSQGIRDQFPENPQYISVTTTFEIYLIFKLRE
jgi:hypothetical protein